ncbi:MAG: glutamate synthase, partial [Schwartzia sp.]|nr:glutamate synthase [Schwartzia sp. (in: firmicutes)]
MCRIGAIKSKTPVQPSMALRLMLPQQEGHDNSGFAMVMQDLYGVFGLYKDKPLLSMACTQQGGHLVEEYMDAHRFVKMSEWLPVPDKRKGLNIQAMPYYIFRTYDYPENVTDPSEREALLLDTRLALREMLTETGQGYVYSFWPDVLMLKEVGDPMDIATYFHLWDDNG